LIKRFLLAGLAGLALEPAVALARDGVSTPLAPSRPGVSLRAEIVPGMSTASLSGLLGRDPDEQSHVGACGSMQMLTWRGDGVRVIAVDGVVSAVTPPARD
jgi:hypothetical protein